MNGMAASWTGSASWWIALWLLTQFIIIGGWDIWCYATGNPMATVSEVIRGWATEYPALPFFFGALMGHLFWH